MASALPNSPPATQDPAAQAFLAGKGSLLDVALKNNTNDPAWKDGQCPVCLLDELQHQENPTLDSVVAQCGSQPTTRGFQPAVQRRDSPFSPQLSGAGRGVYGPDPDSNRKPIKRATLNDGDEAKANSGFTEAGIASYGPERLSKPTRKILPKRSASVVERRDDSIHPQVTGAGKGVYGPDPESNRKLTKRATSDDANADAGGAPGGQTASGYRKHTCETPNKAAAGISEKWDERVKETPELREKFERVFGEVVKDYKDKEGK
ncbi:hypothetical protein B9Z65_927 [Elsinoe australis]|uniref:Uncharacterized protein n=1 Tax=Elsinoe australis TaxID=40998 RepID=A0A2P8AK09_9PEZI|nr:hypothetical protein B9Z65_927 [Elsinoe australis]